MTWAFIASRRLARLVASTLSWGQRREGKVGRGREMSVEGGTEGKGERAGTEEKGKGAGEGAETDRDAEGRLGGRQK